MSDTTPVEAQTVHKVSIKMGRIVEVVNTNKPAFSNAKDKYLAVSVEDENGKNERCLLFTKNEIAMAEHRAHRNPEDIPQKSWLQDLLD